MSKRPKPRGRPRVTGTERSVSISITASANALLEAAVEDAERFAPEFAPASPGPATRGERRTMVAKKKRTLVGELIEKHLSLSGRFPVEVRIVVPVDFTGSEDMIRADGDEVRAWLRAEIERLTAEAPAPVQRAFGRSVLERLRREDPDAHRVAMEDMRAQMLRGEGGDDG